MGKFCKLLENYPIRVYLAKKFNEKTQKLLEDHRKDSLDKSMIVFNINKSMKGELLNLYKELSPFPEVKNVLEELKRNR